MGTVALDFVTLYVFYVIVTHYFDISGSAARLTKDITIAEIEAQLAEAACEAEGGAEVLPVPEVEVVVPEVEACAAEEPVIESVVIPDAVYPEGFDAETIIR